MELKDIAKRYQAYEKTDHSEFRRKARILQSMWREEQGYPIGEHKGNDGIRPLGSRLKMPEAKNELLNYITPTIRQIVREEVIDKTKSKGKLYHEPRIFDDLLSSQPLCFNLFGELKRDLKLTTAVLHEILPDRVKTVSGIEFEFSPGRSNPEYTDDKTAFDVFITYDNTAGKKGFIGIEVKYHEDLQGKPAAHRERYDEIAKQAGCFKIEMLDQFKRKPLQQIWRDHLLSEILRKKNGFDDGLYVFLYPKDNTHCADAVKRYRECLTNTATFADWTLEDFMAIIKKHTRATWIDAVIDRYLNFQKIG